LSRNQSKLDTLNSFRLANFIEHCLVSQSVATTSHPFAQSTSFRRCSRSKLDILAACKLPTHFELQSLLICTHAINSKVWRSFLPIAAYFGSVIEGDWHLEKNLIV
jgi:hypothetical protein